MRNATRIKRVKPEGYDVITHGEQGYDFNDTLRDIRVTGKVSVDEKGNKKLEKVSVRSDK